MSEQDPDAPIISLDAYRDLVRPVTEECEPSQPEQAYQAADYPTYQVAQRVFAALGEQRPFTLMVAHGRQPSRVTEAWRTDDASQVHYALRLDDNEAEVLTVDLEGESEARAERLREPLRLLHAAIYLGHHVLQREGSLTLDPTVSPIRIGDAVVHVEGNRWYEVTRWRAAAQIGILAVGNKRPSLRRELRSHLATILVRRHTYAQSLENLSVMFGVRLSDRDHISDRLLGVTNPLNRFELGKVVKVPAAE